MIFLVKQSFLFIKMGIKFDHKQGMIKKIVQSWWKTTQISGYSQIKRHMDWILGFSRQGVN